MEACELVRLLLNKVTVPTEPKRAGNPGYGIKTATRILIYARLKGLQNDTRITWHLKRHAKDLNAITLGEEQATHLGVETETVKKILLVCVSLMTAAAVSISEVIGFIGCLCPLLLG